MSDFRFRLRSQHDDLLLTEPGDGDEGNTRIVRHIRISDEGRAWLGVVIGVIIGILIACGITALALPSIASTEIESTPVAF